MKACILVRNGKRQTENVIKKATRLKNLMANYFFEWVLNPDLRSTIKRSVYLLQAKYIADFIPCITEKVT